MAPHRAQESVESFDPAKVMARDGKRLAPKRRWGVNRWVGVGMLVVAAVSAGLWWTAREPLPRRIVIATAEQGGLYHKFAAVLAERVTARTGRPVELRPTRGSVENAHLLETGEAQLAILQATALQRSRPALTDLAILAPLYPEVVHIVARVGSRISSVADLAGNDVLIGLDGSGMRESAKRLLEHYRISIDELGRNDLYFMALEEDETIEAAIVTTGLDNPDLRRLLSTGRYELLPVADAEAIGMLNSFFEPFRVPRGLFDERPALPPRDLITIASTSVLAAPRDCSSRLVQAALGALYEDDLRPDFPLLITERRALEMAPVPIHPAARQFLDPYGGLDVVANFIESLTGIKELLFGLAALCYLAWSQVHRLRQREHDRLLLEYKDRLDAYLERTVEIERAQMESTDPLELRAHLRRLTQLKIEAIEELTYEDLRGDRMFLIFLTQCANLTQKIQSRAEYHSTSHP